MPDRIPDITVQVLDQPIGAALVDVAIAAQGLLKYLEDQTVEYRGPEFGKLEDALSVLGREAGEVRGRHEQLERLLKSGQ